MKKRRLWAGLITLVLCLSVTFLTGCTKKGEIKNNLLVTQTHKPIATASTGAADEQAPKEGTLQKQGALQEQTLREQTIGKAARIDRPIPHVLPPVAAGAVPAGVHPVRLAAQRLGVRQRVQLVLLAGGARVVVGGHRHMRHRWDGNLPIHPRRIVGENQPPQQIAD